MDGITRCNEEANQQRASRWLKKIDGFFHKYDKDWLKDKIGALMIVATVIATMTFQTAVNPPGGVWQEFKNNTVDCTPKKNCTAGTSVLGHLGADNYLNFQIWNSMAFISSLVIMFLLISGFPARYPPCMWLLNIFIFSALTFLLLTFQEGMYMVSPSTIKGVAKRISRRLIYIWAFFIGVIILLQIIRILVWIVNKLRKKGRLTITMCAPTQK